jgi:hypothetical protein
MGGAYNKFEEDGIVLDKKRMVNVFAIDFNTTISKFNTYINGEWAWVHVDIPVHILNNTEETRREVLLILFSPF